MKVNYYVDGESGFVPTITYSDNYSPAWGAQKSAAAAPKAQPKVTTTPAKKGRK